MFYKGLLSVFLVVICLTRVSGQNIVSYKDYKNYFYAFDEGMKIKLFHREIESFRAGYKSIAYVTDDNEFWIYHNKKQEKIGHTPREYWVTDHLIVYTSYSNLYFFDDGLRNVLTNNCGNYALGDSVIAFYDDLAGAIEVYYNREIILLENSLDGSYFEAGENIVAYMSSSGWLKAFYRGGIYNLLQGDNFKLKAGLDVIAYTDNDVETFELFIKGKNVALEESLPKSFKCGDQMVVYVNYEGEFIQYCKGSKLEISAFEPDFYEVVDDMIVYSEQGYFKVFYQGESYELENFVPGSFQVDKGKLAYLNQQGQLKYFDQGTVKLVSSQKVTQYTLSGNVLHYSFDSNNYKFLFKGKVY